VRDAALRWFYGLPNLVGIVLALGGLALYLAGAIGTILVPAIVAGLYLLGAIATPRPRGLGTVSAGSGLDAGALRRALDRIDAESKKRLPDDLAAKVDAIRQTILDLLPKLTASTIDRRDLFAVERTVSDYLPRTLDNYLTLPRAYANTHVIENGKTAQQMLGDQLDLIEEKMQEISEAVARDDVTKLLAQGRFLEERFGAHEELSIEPKR
jgi:hypothetical protein